MTRNDLASPPTKAGSSVDMSLIERLASAVERLATAQTAAELELKCFTPEEAAAVLGKTPNWVTEAITARRIPFTYVGRSPRLTAAHIRWVQAQGEVLPHKYARAAA